MYNKSTIQLASIDTCTGCGACMQSCARGAISMVEDREGFLQPHIDTTLCAECHKCEQICPILNPITIPQDFETKAYAAINRDENRRMQSSSGGVFYALAKWTIEQGGVVFGARWDENWQVMHDYAEDLDGVKAFMKSKYVQSRVGETYKQAKKFLNEGRWVLYSGTPCQIGGLHKFLGKDYDKLLMVDLICHGVPSPGVWRKYLKDYVGRDTVLSIDMRDKTMGWKDFQFFTTTTTTTTRRDPQMKNPYFRGFLKNVFLRPSCYDCAFKTTHRISDITLADFWGVEYELPVMDDNKGTSAIFVHTNKGASFLDKLSSVELQSLPIDSVVNHNPSMITSVSMNKIKRRKFYRTILKFGFQKSEYYIDHDYIYVRVFRKIRKLL